MSGDKLYALFKTIAKRAVPDEDMTDLIYGYVKSVDPLKVEIENKYTIEEDQIYLSPFCMHRSIRLTVPNHAHSIPTGSTGVAGVIDQLVDLWRGLQVGDKVILMRHGKGQQFYMLQRAGDLT